LIIFAGIAYPFVVYLGLNTISANILVLGVIAFMGLRLYLLRNATRQRVIPVWPAAFALLAVFLVSLFESEIAVKLYPVIISLTLSAAFTLSLFHAPSLIESFARIMEPDLPESGVRYTWYVSLVWAAYLAINAGIAAWTVFYGTTEQWTLFNGFISYLMTATLFAGEYVFRKYYRAKLK